MLKAVEELSSTKRRLRIEIPAEVVEKEIQKVLKDIQKKANIPGFRPGKAPLSIIEKRCGKDAESTVLEKLVSEIYNQAIKEANLKPVLPPVAENIFNIKRNEPLSFELLVEVRPEIENLKYENIKVEETTIEVKDEEIKEVIQRVLKERGVYEPIEEPAKAEDIVAVDYKTDIGKEGKDYVFKIGSGPFPEEFSKAIEGKRKGEVFTVTIDFPQDSIAEFAEKTVNFEITLREVKRRQELTPEELARELGFDDTEAFKQDIRKSLENTKKEQVLEKQKNEILKELLESHDFELPEGLVELEMRRLSDDLDSKGVDITKHMDRIAEVAKNNVKAFILFDLIGEKEGVQVSEEEVKQEILEIAKRYSISLKGVVEYYMARDGSFDALRQAIFERKVFEIILQKSNKTKKEALQ